ncbi:MAG: ATP-binding protein [Fusobacteriaceae bacterium]
MEIEESKIKSLILKGETKSIEFKKAKNNIPKDLWETYSSFANTDGGVIVLGVSEDNGAFEITGINNPENLMKIFWDIINNPSKINKNILKNKDVSIVEINGKSLLKIEVPRANFNDRPISCNENPYIGTYKRNHSGDYRCQKEEVNSLIRNSSKILDNYILEYYTFEEDIDKSAFKGYRNIYNVVKRDHPWSELSDDEFLKRIGGMDKDIATGKTWLTVAGLLMFGNFNSVRRVFPNYHLDYFDKTSGENERWDDRVMYDGTWGEGNIFNFYFIVINKLKKNLKVPFKIAEDGYTRIDETLAHVAIREALINSIVHADYKEESPLKIVMYEDRYEFYNPGLLRISRDRIFHGGYSNPRNSTIMQMLNQINLCERAGSGFPKILSAVQEYKWKEPEIDEDQYYNYVKVTIWIESTGEYRRVPESTGEYWRVPEPSKAEEEYLSQKELIIKYLEENKRITRKEVEKILKVEESRARKILQQIAKSGCIKKEGVASKTFYILNKIK